MSSTSMSFSIMVAGTEGQFVASLVGVPEVQAAGSSREAAVAGLKQALRQRVAEGELLSLEVEAAPLWGLGGLFADDPTLPDVCSDAYAARDADLR